MDIFKRPIYCSDAKKKIIYAKDEDKWEQEDKDEPKLRKALNKMAKKSMCKDPEVTSNADNHVKNISEILKDPCKDNIYISYKYKNKNIEVKEYMYCMLYVDIGSRLENKM